MTSLRFLPEQIEQWPLARLKPYERNPRLHSDDQVAKVAASIASYGWTVPLLVTEDGEVIAGHGRLLAARHLGLTEVPVIRLSHLSPEQVRAYRVADNQLVLAGAWDEELLAAELHALNAAGFDLDLTGFDQEELDRLLAPLDEGDGLAGEDVIPEPPLNPVSRLGDLWLLGDHRLLCGDCTKADDVIRVMHNHKAILFASDPPYLVSTTEQIIRRSRAGPTRTRIGPTRTQLPGTTRARGRSCTRASSRPRSTTPSCPTPPGTAGTPAEGRRWSRACGRSSAPSSISRSSGPRTAAS